MSECKVIGGVRRLNGPETVTCTPAAGPTMVITNFDTIETTAGLRLDIWIRFNSAAAWQPSWNFNIMFYQDAQARTNLDFFAKQVITGIAFEAEDLVEAYTPLKGTVNTYYIASAIPTPFTLTFNFFHNNGTNTINCHNVIRFEITLDKWIDYSEPWTCGGAASTIPSLEWQGWGGFASNFVPCESIQVVG